MQQWREHLAGSAKKNRGPFGPRGFTCLTPEVLPKRLVLKPVFVAQVGPAYWGRVRRVADSEPLPMAAFCPRFRYIRSNP